MPVEKPEVMDLTYHYPPEVLDLLVETIPRLVKAKDSVILFFQGAGVNRQLLAKARTMLADNPKTNKFVIARTILVGMNELGERGIAQRREVIKRVAEYDDFTRPYPDDQLKARGLVAQVQNLVNIKDSFTRMEKEVQAARREHIGRQERELAVLQAKREQREKAARDLNNLFSERDASKRGKMLEQVLNDLFAAFDILIRESFELRNENGVCLEQIDGVIELDSYLYFVEMKWTKEPIGVPELSQHLVRVYHRNCARALFISAANYTAPAHELAKESLQRTVLALSTLREFVLLLERQLDLKEVLRTKFRAAITHKNPWYDITGT